MATYLSCWRTEDAGPGWKNPFLSVAGVVNARFASVVVVYTVDGAG